MFIKRARRIARSSSLGVKLALLLEARPQAAPDNTARNRKFLAKRLNYQGHERPALATRVPVTGCAEGEGIITDDANRKPRIVRETYGDSR
jgi:hypothetical protein